MNAQTVKQACRVCERMSEHAANCDALVHLTSDVRVLLAKYEGRSKWVGFEPARREAWAEIERDLRTVVARVIPPETTS